MSQLLPWATAGIPLAAALVSGWIGDKLRTVGAGRQLILEDSTVMELMPQDLEPCSAGLLADTVVSTGYLTGAGSDTNPAGKSFHEAGSQAGEGERQTDRATGDDQL